MRVLAPAFLGLPVGPQPPVRDRLRAQIRAFVERATPDLGDRRIRSARGGATNPRRPGARSHPVGRRARRNERASGAQCR
jgi:hypothetical protein